MLHFNACKASRTFLSRCLTAWLHPSPMVLQQATVGELPFYYGGPSNRPAVIVLQVCSIGNGRSAGC